MGIGDQQELAIYRLRECQSRLVNAIAESIGLEIHLDDAPQASVADGVIETRFGTAIGQFAAPVGFAFILRIELADPLLGLINQGLDVLRLRRHFLLFLGPPSHPKEPKIGDE